LNQFQAITLAAEAIAKTPRQTGHSYYLIVRNGSFHTVGISNTQENDYNIITLNKIALDIGLTSNQWFQVETRIRQLIEKGSL